MENHKSARESTWFAPQLLNMKNIKGYFPTHRGMGFYVSMGAFICNEQRRMNQMLLQKNPACFRESHRTSQPK